MKWEIVRSYMDRESVLGVVEAETIEAAAQKLGFDRIERSLLVSDSFHFLHSKEERGTFRNERARGDVVYWVYGVYFNLRPQVTNLLDKDGLMEAMQSAGFAPIQGKAKVIDGNVSYLVEVDYREKE